MSDPEADMQAVGPPPDFSSEDWSTLTDAMSKASKAYMAGYNACEQYGMGRMKKTDWTNVMDQSVGIINAQVAVILPLLPPDPVTE